MGHSVYLTDDAAADLEDLYGYIEQQDVQGKADYVLDKIEKALISLASNSERGAYPQELLALGMREFREIRFKPYRIIYRVTEGQVNVMVIADGRRDMRSLLERRLLWR